MKPAQGASHTTGLVWAVIDLAVAWVVIVWLTRRMKRDISAGND